MVAIKSIHASRVWDSRGLPTIEAEISFEDKSVGRGIAPSGASTGFREFRPLLDGGSRLSGKDVSLACLQVQSDLAPRLVGIEFQTQGDFDSQLRFLKDARLTHELGGNVTTALSLAFLDAIASSRQSSRWQILGPGPSHVPRPQIQILGGGAHANGRVSVQDFMVYPVSATQLDEALVEVAEVYLATGRAMKKRSIMAGVADEGGYWPNVEGTREALDTLMTGIEEAGFEPGSEIAISLDIAASQLYQDGSYFAENRKFSPDEWISFLLDIENNYPIATLEDPVFENDHAGMTRAVDEFQAVIVGDDFLVTDSERVRQVGSGSVDATLIKVNQVGNVTDAAEAVVASRENGLGVIVSARSGETEDTALSHLAVGWSADVMKVGSISRGERTAKWNELLRINRDLGQMPLAPPLRKAVLENAITL